MNKVKVTFELDLDDPDEAQRYVELSGKQLSNLRCAMHSFAEQTLRKYRKFGGTKAAVEAFSTKEYGIHTIHDKDAPVDSYCDTTVAMIEREFYEALETFEAKIDE